MSTVVAYKTPLPTRSILAVTRSPGIAPATRTTCPSARAIIRPPAAGFSMVSERVLIDQCLVLRAWCLVRPWPVVHGPRSCDPCTEDQGTDQEPRTKHQVLEKRDRRQAESFPNEA